MNVTEAKFKDRQLQRKGHLQKVSAEQKEYAEASACRRIAESTDIITDLQTAGLLEKILHRDNLNKQGVQEGKIQQRLRRCRRNVRGRTSNVLARARRRA